MKIVSLFAGAGGEVLGAHRAGLEHVEAVEWDHDAADALELATGGGLFGRAHPVWGAPPLLVRRCSVADWTPAAADVWWASPPCQPDSIAGKRLGGDDPRDGWPMVWNAYDRAVVKPRWVVCETVAGILRSTAAERWERIVAEFEDRFGAVEWRVLDAADYGVPQHRRRCILVVGPRTIEWPEVTHGPDAARPWVSMGEALGINGVLDGGRNSAANPTQERPRPTTEPAPTVGGRGNQMLRIIGGGHNPSRPGDVRRYLDLTGGKRRRLTVAECATLQGFPERWPFQGTLEAQYRQVGNAVPPRLAEVVLRAVEQAGEKFE